MMKKLMLFMLITMTVKQQFCSSSEVLTDFETLHVSEVVHSALPALVIQTRKDLQLDESQQQRCIKIMTHFANQTVNQFVSDCVENTLFTHNCICIDEVQGVPLLVKVIWTISGSREQSWKTMVFVKLPTSKNTLDKD